MSYSKTAENIVGAIIKEIQTAGHTLVIDDLIEQGVTGSLLNEVMKLLDRTNLVIDTQYPEYFEELVEKNVKRCQQELLSDIQAKTLAELAMLTNKGATLIGLFYDRQWEQRLVEADSGRCVVSKRFSESAKQLFSFASEGRDTICELDGEIVGVDRSGISIDNIN